MSPSLMLAWLRAVLEAVGLIRRAVEGVTEECPTVAAARGTAAGEAAKRSSDATTARMRGAK